MEFDVLYTDEAEELLYSKGMLKKVPRHQKGHEQIRKILSTTLDLLLEKGYSNVSYGHLSSILSMAKGNIQYYFPTRDSLLRSAMLLQMEGLKREWLAAATKPASDQWERLDNIIEWDLAYSRSTERKALFLEKRAYATRDVEARKIVNDWYSWVIARLSDVLADLRPDLPRNGLAKLAAMIIAMLDGMAPYFGRRRLIMKSLADFDQVIHREICALVKNFGKHR